MFSNFNQAIKSYRRRFVKNMKKRRWVIRLLILKQIILTRPFLVKAAIFLTVVSILLCGYNLWPEGDEDIVLRASLPGPDRWPGMVYRSYGRKPTEVKVLKKKSQRILDAGPDSVKEAREKNRQTVRLAVVSCEGRMEEALTMLKSAILFSRHVRVDIVAVTDRESQFKFYNKIDELRNAAVAIGLDVEYEVYASWVPLKNQKLWASIRHPCSLQKLFFPTMFPHLDSIMYIDSDVYFVSDLAHLWGFFSLMNHEQLASMAPEHELPGDGWYNRHSKTPYYGPRGLNAGVMLMNLTRMRAIGLEDRVASILETYSNLLVQPDQDILNVLFHFYPEYLLELNCMYNFRGQHCSCDFPGGGCGCKSVVPHGAAVIHGNRRRFRYYTNSSLEFLRDFYNDFHQYDLRSNAPDKLYEKLLVSYNRVVKEPCGMKGEVLLSNFKHYLIEMMLNKRFFNA